MEEQMDYLAEALPALAHGLDHAQLSGFDPTHAARAARLADEILRTATHAAGAS